MKLFVAAICLLCCCNAVGQTITTPKQPLGLQRFTVQDCIGWEDTNGLEHYEKCQPQSAQKKQLICDWAKDKWFCPTREPISNLDGKLVPEPSKEPCAGFKQNPDGTWNAWAHCQAGEGEEIQIPPPEPQFKLIAPPFDVPAKAESEPANNARNHCYNATNLESKDWKEVPCMGAPHATCADKSRFLMQSEDGKHHCLKLVP